MNELEKFFENNNIKSLVEKRHVKTLANNIIQALMTISDEINPNAQRAAIELACISLRASNYILSSDSINHLYSNFSHAGLFVTETAAERNEKGS